MECVAKFMEQGNDFVIGKKCWLTCCRFWNVEVVTDHRELTQKEALVDQIIHPRTAALGITCVEVTNKES